MHKQYGEDVIVFLMLKSVPMRLTLNEKSEEHEGAAQLLWEAAVRVEDGKRLVVLKQIEGLEKKPQRVLGETGKENEINRLLQGLSDVGDEYVENTRKAKDLNIEKPPSQDFLILMM